MRVIVVMVALAFCSSAVAFAQEREVLNVPGQSVGLPFSSAVRVGNLLFLSGQIGNTPGTLNLAPGGTRGQTRQTMENIKQVLEYLGSSMDRVIKCTIFLDDMSEYGIMNEEYAKFFPEAPPARSTLGADGLALGAAVEIECIALVGTSR